MHLFRLLQQRSVSTGAIVNPISDLVPMHVGCILALFREQTLHELMSELNVLIMNRAIGQILGVSITNDKRVIDMSTPLDTTATENAQREEQAFGDDKLLMNEFRSDRSV
ncbi:hypothetical protein Tcan_08605 [Toxocara canis]|uniref:Uncharacterized protein n=1 Tax=Toxocara canis TaxID=6265 RepID=A0A0B2UYH0_TOXCA|nr:hypothetical protein Tcan_08605 [Toxocara canis]